MLQQLWPLGRNQTDKRGRPCVSGMASEAGNLPRSCQQCCPWLSLAAQGMSGQDGSSTAATVPPARGVRTDGTEPRETVVQDSSTGSGLNFLEALMLQVSI